MRRQLASCLLPCLSHHAALGFFFSSRYVLMVKHTTPCSISFSLSPIWTFTGEHVNPSLAFLRMRLPRRRRRRISRRSGSNSAVWASSSSRAKPFSIFSICLTPFQNGVSLHTKTYTREGAAHPPNE